ncbi:MAG: tetratricopeptide repeat protein, partial [Gemmataceae bacterium]
MHERVEQGWAAADNRVPAAETPAMKAEHRKELMTNTLAHRLGEAVQTMKEGPSRGTIFVLAAVGLIVILILVWRYLATSAEESDSARWLKWDSLSTPGQLKAFVEDKDVQGQPQGRLARLTEARRALHDGLQQLGSTGNRKDALADIQKAAELYDQLAGEFADKPLLHQQVLMGAAKAHESLGDAEQAGKYYQQVKDKYGDTVFGKDAAEQLQRLHEAEQNGNLKA